MKRVALYPGSFDPLTNGHLDLIKRSLKLFDELVVAVLENPSKKPLFTADERVAMVARVVKPLKRVRVVRFDGLLVHLAHRLGNPTVIRGLRRSRTLPTCAIASSCKTPGITGCPGKWPWK